MEKLYIAVVELGFSTTDGKYDTSVYFIEVLFTFLWIELQRTLLEMSFRVMPFDRFVMAIDQNILTLTEEFVKRVILGSRRTPSSLENQSTLAFRTRQRSEILHYQRTTNSYVTKQKLGKTFPIYIIHKAKRASFLIKQTATSRFTYT